MKTTLKNILLPALVVLLVVFAFTNKTQGKHYEFMIVEYNDNTSDLSTSLTSGSFSTRNVKSILLDKYNDRTPFLNEIKTQEGNGWEAYSYGVTTQSNANYYSCLLRKEIN